MKLDHSSVELEDTLAQEETSNLLQKRLDQIQTSNLKLRVENAQLRTKLDHVDGNNQSQYKD